MFADHVLKSSKERVLRRDPGALGEQASMYKDWQDAPSPQITKAKEG